MLPHTPQRWIITTNLKTKNNQNFHIIKLHAISTTKELKKHSSRTVGGEEMGSQVERMQGKAADLTEEVGLAEWETKDSKPLAVNYCRGCKGRRNSSFTGQSIGVLECTQTHPSRNQHPKGHNPLVGSKGSDGKQGK